MADSKISDLTAVVTPAGSDECAVNQGGTTKKETLAQIQTFSNTNSTITGTVTVPNTGLHLLDTDASHDLIVKPGSDLSADRTLNIVTGDSDRTLTINADATLGDIENIVTVGKSGAQFTTIGAALSSISGASQSNWYVIKVGPGEYGESVTPKAFVDIQGSGNSTILNDPINGGGSQQLLDLVAGPYTISNMRLDYVSGGASQVVMVACAGAVSDNVTLDNLEFNMTFSHASTSATAISLDDNTCTPNILNCNFFLDANASGVVLKGIHSLTSDNPSLIRNCYMQIDITSGGTVTGFENFENIFDCYVDELSTSVFGYVGNGALTNCTTSAVGVFEGSTLRGRVKGFPSNGSTADGKTIIFVAETASPRTITITSNEIASPGTIFIIVDTSSSGGPGAGSQNITVDTEGSETINGVSSVKIEVDFGVLRLISDGFNLFII